MAWQKRLEEVDLVEVGSVFFASSSIGGGINLIYSTIPLMNSISIESDKLYTMYGGFCVIWISVSSLRKKTKSPDTAAKT